MMKSIALVMLMATVAFCANPFTVTWNTTTGVSSSTVVIIGSNVVATGATLAGSTASYIDFVATAGAINITQALTSQYITFTVSAVAGCSLSVTNIAFTATNASYDSYVNGEYYVYSSADNYVSQLDNTDFTDLSRQSFAPTAFADQVVPFSWRFYAVTTGTNQDIARISNAVLTGTTNCSTNGTTTTTTTTTTLSPNATTTTTLSPNATTTTTTLSPNATTTTTTKAPNSTTTTTTTTKAPTTTVTTGSTSTTNSASSLSTLFACVVAAASLVVLMF